ncbi:MAG TPA: sugar ABC transporter permease [Ilumatobacteraceae bacterium]
MSALITMVISVVVSLALLAAFFTGLNLAVDRLPQKWDDRIRPWVFVGPALLILLIALVVPAIRTIYLSFRSGRRGEEGWTLENYTDTLTDDAVLSFDNYQNIFTSWLFFGAIALLVVAVGAAWASSRREQGSGARPDFSAPSSTILIVVAAIAILMAIFSTLRGIIWNNLWWVVAVTGLSTVIGLALAVLADRSRSETAAKTLIFMPMAISMVGAAIIWSYMYNLSGVTGQSPGLLNEVIGWFGIDPIDFLRDADIVPWNNFFIMVIMIWIQTGFAMVVLSAAIKSVPAELIEAAKVDGANDMQVFWKITVPQITPTIIVVVTTLIVTVMKIFDLVKATTNGNFDTDVLANRMYDNLRDGNFTLSSTFAVIVLLLVLPVMVFNFRRAKEGTR